MSFFYTGKLNAATISITQTYPVYINPLFTRVIIGTTVIIVKLGIQVLIKYSKMTIFYFINLNRERSHNYIVFS